MFEQVRVNWQLRKLSSADWRKREAAVKALGEIGGQLAVDPLIRALQDPDYNVRRSAANALGQLGAKNAIDPLIELLGDEAYSVRSYAASALAKLGEGSWQQVVKGDKEDLDRLGGCKDPRAVMPLLHALKQAPPLHERSFWSHRKAAAKALVQVATESPSFLKGSWDNVKKLATAPHSDSYASDRKHSDTGVGMTFPDEP